LSSVDKEAALEVLLRDCLIPLGTCVSISGFKESKAIQQVASLILGNVEHKIQAGDFLVFELESDSEVKLIPTKNSIDVGAGAGKELVKIIKAEGSGLIIDARGRPLRDLKLESTFKAMKLDVLRA